MSDKFEYSEKYLRKVINVAKGYTVEVEKPCRLSELYLSIADAKDQLLDSLKYEAYLSYQSKICLSQVIEDNFLKIVNIYSDNPGVIKSYDEDERMYCVYWMYGNTEFVDEDSLNKLDIYPNPMSYERHINALNACSPEKHMWYPLLRGYYEKKMEIEKRTVVELKEILKSKKLKISGKKDELISRLQSIGYNPEPFILYHGPPGTGKTYKLILRLKEILDFSPNAKVLLCAPSNIGTINMYLRARSLDVKGSLCILDEKIPKNMINSDEKEQWHPETDNVVFSTVSGRYNSILRSRDFEYVILDEAAQCPENWAWGLLQSGTKQLVMAGDPQQLPALCSQEGIPLRHNVSLMERLISLNFDNTLLDVQRRMHPDIVYFPNKEYYDSKLKTQFDDKNSKKISPYSIINVNCQETRQGTSYENQIEAQIVLQLAQKLVQNYSDIVIIAPYKAQCELLITLLNKNNNNNNNNNNIQVHTLDSFQGREADVVLLSVVRTNKLGFWDDERRLNVGLTRAKHVLRIVGNTDKWTTGPLQSLKNDAKERNLIKNVSIEDQLKLGLKLSENIIQNELNKQKWTIHHPFQLNNNKYSNMLLKLSKGKAKVYNNQHIYTYKHEDSIVYFHVILKEIENKRCKQEINVIDYREKGGVSDVFNETIQKLNKLNPKYLEHLIYAESPSVFEEIPRKEREFVVKEEKKKDKMIEKIQAQKFVESLRRR